MKLLAVVTPQSIYNGCSTRKTFWEEKSQARKICFCLWTWKIVVVARLGNKRRSRLVTSMSPWTSHQSFTVWTRWRSHLQIQTENWKYQERGWLPLWVSITKQGYTNKKVGWLVTSWRRGKEPSLRYYVTEYRIVYGTRVLYDYTRLSLGLY